MLYPSPSPKTRLPTTPAWRSVSIRRRFFSSCLLTVSPHLSRSIRLKSPSTVRVSTVRWLMMCERNKSKPMSLGKDTYQLSHLHCFWDNAVPDSFSSQSALKPQPFWLLTVCVYVHACVCECVRVCAHRCLYWLFLALCLVIGYVEKYNIKGDRTSILPWALVEPQGYTVNLFTTKLNHRALLLTVTR